MSPPEEIQKFLVAHGFTEVKIGEATWYRREGCVPVPWQEAPAQVVDALTAQVTALTTKVSALPRRGWQTSEFWAVLAGYVTVGVVAVQGQLFELADELGPTWGKVLNIAVSLAVAAAGGRFATLRKGIKEDSREP